MKDELRGGFMITIYNSTFETSLRLLCLLYSVNCNLNVDQIMLMDFIASYGKTYRIYYKNLNGENPLVISELPARRVRIQRALKQMVQSGYAIPDPNDIALYRISNKGKQYVQALKSNYARAYITAANNAYNAYGGYENTELLMLVCSNNGGAT